MSACVHAQDFIFKNFTRENGLPGTEVYNVLQDSKGYIWGITEGGVFKYNGETFKTFSAADGLPGYAFFTLFEDRKGRVWTSSFNSRVGYFLNDHYYQIDGNDSLSGFLRFGNRLIYNIYVDSGDTLWLSTLLNVIKVSPAGNYSNISVQYNFPDSISRILFEVEKGHVISSVHTSRSNSGLVIPFDSIQRRSIGIKTKDKDFIIQLSDNDVITATPVSREIMSSDGRIFMSYSNKLFCINKDDSYKITTFKSYIIKLVEDKFKNLWVCFSRGGMWKYANGNLDSVPEKYLHDLSIGSLMIDNENSLWVCTLEDGLYYSPTLQSKIYHNTGKFDAKITGITTMDNGILAATRNNDFIKIKNDSVVEIKDYRLEKSGERTLFYRYKNKIYISGLLSGVIDSANEAIAPYGMKTYPVSSLDVTFGKGDTLYRLTIADIYVSVNDKMIDTIQLPLRGRSILYDGSKLLLGGLTGLYEVRDKEVFFMGDKDKRLAARVNYLFEDSLGRVWSCTKGEGLLYRIKGVWHQLNTSNGLNTNLCNYIEPAGDKVFYVATENGICKVEMKNDVAVVTATYDASNGLSGSEVNCLVYDDNNLWAGTNYGLIKINLEEPTFNQFAPPVYFNHILLNDSLIIPAENKPTYDYNENNFTFYVDVLSYKGKNGKNVQYQLIYNSDTTEKKIENKEIVLQNLPPGEYSLKVWGINNNDVLSLTPAQFDFSIAKPFWLTWWFLSLVFITGCILVISVFRWRINFQKRKQAEQIEIERKLSSYKLQALHAQMNPHFVFNAINSIQSQILQKKQHEAYNHLTKFSQLIRLVLVNTNEQTITIAKEIEALKLYVELEQLRFEDSFEFDLITDDNLPLENTTMPAMIIQPFVENAIWHGLMPLNGIRKAKLLVEIKKEGDKIFVAVEDNGIGRDKSNEIKKTVNHKSLGISLTQERIELLAKTGSRMKISDVTDANYNITGTRVEIWI